MYCSDTVIELAKNLAVQFASRATEADKLGRLPIEDIEALKSTGYLALNIPKKFGGSELSLKDCVLAQLELAQGSPSSALVAAMPLHLFGQASEHRLWSNENYARFCNDTVAGAVFNVAGTEPLLGSPSRGQLYASTAKKVDDGLLVSGHKICTTGGRHLTHMLVSVMHDNKPVSVLVEAHLSGVSWQENWGSGLSLRASDSHDVFFDDVLIPQQNLLISESPKTNKSGKAWFMFMMASVYLGAAIGARNSIIHYALERVPTALGKPIATLPKIQRQIGEIDVSLQAAKSLLLETADKWGHCSYENVVMAKYFALQVANDVTEKAMFIAGSVGLTQQLPLERYFRDVRAGMMQPPAGDTALELVGQHAINTVVHKYKY